MPSGEHFWTANAGEKDILVSQGASYEGIPFYVDPPDANSGYLTYRLSSINGHILTTNIAEKNQLLVLGYNYEGAPFSTPSSRVEVWAPQSNQALVYRLFSPISGRHFWTTSIFERDSLMLSGFNYEGVGMTSDSTGTGNPVYRMFKPSTGEHFWTASSGERDALLRSGFVYEGVSWNQF